ncbi:hypothetical protein ACFL38_02850 [Candidatus Omnitrophota bacterium]
MKIGERFFTNYDEEIKGVIVNGKKITKGDLWGISEEDSELGYAPKENAVSFNGWWQSNNVGARSRNNTSRHILSGMQRIIIFGESFTNCSRIPQEETWPFFLNNKSNTVEFLNFGVDGYSMCQCLLRYENLKSKIDYDIVMLVFVVSTDLWRDINTLRQLRGWENYPLIPRYCIENNQLKLIKSPYKSYEDLERENANNLSDTLKKHLRTYDRFYSKVQYESPAFIGKLISYKLLAERLHYFQKKSLLDNIMKTDSEAMIVSQKIFEEMNNKAKRDGKKFVLVFLPLKRDVEDYRNNSLFRKKYDKIVSYIEKEDMICIDLMKDFLKVKLSQFDFDYYGIHYGLKTNKIISEILWENLEALKLLTHKKE